MRLGSRPRAQEVGRTRPGPAKAAGSRTDTAELPAGQECGGWEEVRGDQTEPAGGPVAGREIGRAHV